MNIGKITILTLIAAGLGAFQYQRDIQAARGERSAAQKALSEASDALLEKKEQIAAISKATAEEAAELKEDRNSLERDVAALQKDKATLVQQFTLAVQQVRSATVSMRWPTMNLADGRVLKEAVILRVSDSAVEFSHSGGTEQIPADKLPQELQDRLHYIVAPSQVAIAEQPAPGTPAQASPQMSGNASAAIAAGLESSIRQLEETREKLHQTKSTYVRQAMDYRNKDALARQLGKPMLYKRIIPEVEASVYDLATKISEVSVQISNLEIQLVTIKPGALGRS